MQLQHIFAQVLLQRIITIMQCSAFTKYYVTFFITGCITNGRQVESNVARGLYHPNRSRKLYAKYRLACRLLALEKEWDVI
jgi:hypothetical protein